jgi:hypothetical protein
MVCFPVFRFESFITITMVMKDQPQTRSLHMYNESRFLSDNQDRLGRGKVNVERRRQQRV